MSRVFYLRLSPADRDPHLTRRLGSASLLLAKLSCVAMLLLLTAAFPVRAETRVALVIGVSAYQNVPSLGNPVNDARAIGESLRRLNFDVQDLLDPDLRTLTRGIREFGIRAQTADVAVVYYAGHGVQVDRENYLLPADAKLERERDLLYEALPLANLLGEVSQANKIGILLLDACRNNPFTNRQARSLPMASRALGGNPGLARVDNVPRNTMVVMAAKADQIAEDGDEHSPFADALLAHFQIPGLELSLFFRSVRDAVLRATGNRQEPYVFSSLGAEPFYFYPRPPNRPPEMGSISRLEVLDTAGPTPLGIPRPIDPDQDPMTVRIIGLPLTGEVHVEGRAVAPNSVFSLDRFMTATFKPDRRILGPIGTLDILIEDGRGGATTASLPITVLSSNHPPVVEAARKLRAYPTQLRIAPPTDPDGDPVTVTIVALPRGLVRNGTAAVEAGDRLQPDELAGLGFVADPGAAGDVGSLRYSVEDGRGGVSEGRLDIEVADPAEMVSESKVWADVRDKGGAAELDAFLRLFPSSRFAGEARHRLDALATAAVAAVPPTTPAQAAPSPPQAPTLAAREPAAASASQAATLPIVPPTDVVAPPPAGAGKQLAMLQPMPLPRPAAPVPAAPSPPAPAATGTTQAVTPRTASVSRSADARIFDDCANCPTMARVPEGSFVMGQGSHEPEAMPPHRVAVKAFALGQYPVTVAEWKACMADGGCGFLPRMAVADDRVPVHNVSWDDAQHYVGWLSHKTGQRYRLPSEAEWEYAARAGAGSRYWWGNEMTAIQVNCLDCGGRQDPHAPLPVDGFKANGFGLSDMLGGVAQWTADCWFPNYQGAPADASARDTATCLKRVLRGGSFRGTRDQITVTARDSYDSSVRYFVNGFRVARDLN